MHVTQSLYLVVCTYIPFRRILLQVVEEKVLKIKETFLYNNLKADAVVISYLIHLIPFTVFIIVLFALDGFTVYMYETNFAFFFMSIFAIVAFIAGSVIFILCITCFLNDIKMANSVAQLLIFMPVVMYLTYLDNFLIYLFIWIPQISLAIFFKHSYEIMFLLFNESQVDFTSYFILTLIFLILMIEPIGYYYFYLYLEQVSPNKGVSKGWCFCCKKI